MSEKKQRMFTRKKADEHLSLAIDGIRRVNMDDYYSKGISRCLVVGPYVSNPDADRIPALEIAIELKDKWPSRELQQDMERLQGFYCPKNYGEMHYWMAPREETFKRVRHGCSFIKLMELGTVDEEKIRSSYMEIEVPKIRYSFPEIYMAEALCLSLNKDPRSEGALMYAELFDQFPPYKAMMEWLNEHPEAYVPIDEML